jgi:predicted ATPase/signal transduction histidine kinase/tRNA A-37 threonylcarbamoyl transferase component Bud32
VSAQLSSTGFSVGALVREGSRSAVYRGVRLSDGAPVIVKMLRPERQTPLDLERLHRECEIAQRIQSASVVKAYGIALLRDSPALVMEDFGGASLGGMLGGPLAIHRFLELAIRITRAVAEVHKSGVVHHDVKPANLIVHPETFEVKITDFGLATVPPAGVAEGRLRGTLAYMAPEQSGRMNRPADRRADLYSLGVTFFQMLTGALPFHATDALGWTHAHIARTPASPRQLESGVPEVLSDMVLKLLAKSAEDRYQTASGLGHDLARCAASWQETGRIERFELASDDLGGDFQLPQKLYGREEELAVLRGAFERTMASGAHRVLAVAGYAGVGKSSLVRELQPALAAARGFFATGKFDQYRRHVPYSAIAQALAEVVQQLLASADTLEERKKELSATLGVNARVLVDVVPELAALLGRPPPVGELGPAEAQNRFMLAFRALLSVISRPEHPLALFLDDLQWADSGSLELLRAVSSGPEPLLFVLAYRDNEMDAAHPSTITLGALASSMEVERLELRPLGTESLSALLGGALRRPPAACAELALLLKAKTDGNPFFVGEFLKTLHEEGLLRFDPEQRCFRFSLAEIETKGITDNVVDLLIGRLRRLPVEAQRALQLAACIGSRFDEEQLALAAERPVPLVTEDLGSAVIAGLVSRDGGGVWRFGHDRVQQAAYALIPEERRAAVHLGIGRRMRGERGSELGGRDLFDVVHQLDAARSLIDDRAELDDVLELNLAAGRRARASNAYGPARRFLSTALGLLPEGSFSTRHALTFAITVELAESETLSGRLEVARELFAGALAHAASDLERGRVLYLEVKLLQVAGDFDGAISSALRSFELFGLKPPGNDAEAGRAVAEEAAEAERLLGGRPVSTLLDAPLLDAPDIRMACDLLEASAPPIYMLKPALFPWITLKLVNLSLRHGHSPASCYGYGVYAILLSAAMGQVERGNQFGQLAIDLNDKLGDLKLRGCMLHLLGDHVNFWKRHISTDLPILERGFLACLEGGDLVYSNYIGFQSPWHLYESGAPLDQVHELTEKYAAFALQTRYLAVHATLRTEQQFIASLQGRTRGPETFDADGFDESEALALIRAAKFNCGIVYFHILKLIAHFTYGDLEGALREAALAAPELGAAFSMPMEVSFHLYRALALAAARGRDAVPEVEAAWLSMQARARDCPENFEHKAALIGAELARIKGDVAAAMPLYELAITSARRGRFTQYEGLACELAGRFQLALGGTSAGMFHIAQARRLYKRFGALGKTAHLLREFPELAEVFPASDSLSTASSSDQPAAQLDLLPVVKASQTISGEIILEQLLGKLISIVIEYAGAERGFVLLEEEGVLVVGATADVNEPERVPVPSVMLPISSGELVPMSVVTYVQRTGERVLLEDARMQSAFSADPYIAHHRPRSMLCLPIARQGKLTGMFYLENNKLVGAFSGSRLAVLELLAAQIAISLDNSRLYRASQDAISVRDQFLSIASHELRTPLTPLKLHLQSLMRLVRQNPEAIPRGRLEALVGVTEKAITRMTRLIESLLDAGRIETGRFAIHREEVDLRALARELPETYAAEIAAARCTLEMRGASPVVGAFDRLRIEQVLVSLLMNALKFAPNEPVVISVEAREGKAVLTVQDRGPGLSETEAARLFRRFERVASRNFGGLGLGLFISRQIAEAHGGRIRVESTPGSGATFVVELPLQPGGGGPRHEEGA